MNVLGIESSCDECSVAVVADGKKILSNVVATQIPLHQPYMGVVPEIASRTHVEWIKGVVHNSLETAGCTLKDIDGIAVTAKPGLAGSLLVGLSYAKALSYAADPMWRFWYQEDTPLSPSWRTTTRCRLWEQP